jgi:hypothetical protein
MILISLSVHVQVWVRSGLGLGVDLTLKHRSSTQPNTAPSSPVLPPMVLTSHSTTMTPNSRTFNSNANTSSCALAGVHNTNLLTCNPSLRYPMCGQFTSNAHMFGSCPPLLKLKLKLFTTCTVCAGFTPKAVCAGCCPWALPTMPYRELTSQS